MYGEGIRPKDFGEAAALANPLRDDPAEAKRRVRAAYDTFLRLGKTPAWDALVFPLPICHR